MAKGYVSEFALQVVLEAIDDTPRSRLQLESIAGYTQSTICKATHVLLGRDLVHISGWINNREPLFSKGWAPAAPRPQVLKGAQKTARYRSKMKARLVAVRRKTTKSGQALGMWAGLVEGDCRGFAPEENCNQLHSAEAA